MKNEYDDEHFFNEYAQMTRSREGLAGAGEWHQFRRMFPPLEGSRVLDLGCGYGWHCKYAVEQGAEKVLGIDVSRRMIREAEKRNQDERITYEALSLEEYDYPEEAWPSEEMMGIPGMKDEMRRPMMLMIRAGKQ